MNTNIQYEALDLADTADENGEKSLDRLTLIQHYDKHLFNKQEDSLKYVCDRFHRYYTCKIELCSLSEFGMPQKILTNTSTNKGGKPRAN